MKSVQRELLFSSQARIVERFGMPDILIASNGIGLKYYVEDGCIVFPFIDGVLISISRG